MIRTKSTVQMNQHTFSMRRKFYFTLKRATDLFLASLILVVGAPIMLVLAVLIRLDSPGPIFFKQMRVGQDGRPFKLYKFRTMHHNSDSEIHRRYVQAFIRNQSASNGGNNGENAPFKLVKDPRITRVGAILRQTSLDELPQIFNVIRGEMSLVGPRPPLPYEVEAYQDWHRGRLATVPGITGWWQVRGRSLVPFDEMVRMDLEYISRQSLLLDLKILLLTIPVIIFAKGAR